MSYHKGVCREVQDEKPGKKQLFRGEWQEEKMKNYRKNKKVQITAIVIVAIIILAMVLTLIPSFML